MKIDQAIANAGIARRNRYYVVVEREEAKASSTLSPEGVDVVMDELKTVRMLYIVNRHGLLKREGLWRTFERTGWKLKVLKRQAAMRYAYDKTVKG